MKRQLLSGLFCKLTVCNHGIVGEILFSRAASLWLLAASYDKP